MSPSQILAELREIILDFTGSKTRSEAKMKNSLERNSEGEEPGGLRCEVCDIKASSITRLERHRRLHQTLENSSSFKCLQCRKSFDQLAKLLIHKHSHSRLKPGGVCNLCRARYSNIAWHHQNYHILLSNQDQPQPHIFI